MSSIAAVLKSEIIRLARKEVKQEVAQLRKQVTAHRSALAALKRQLAEVDRRAKQGIRSAKAPLKLAADGVSAARFSAKGLKTLRAKLGLSAADFGRLAGVSGQSIYNWEAGKAKPQKAQLAALQPLRSMGKRAAIARLEALGD
jgi:DNA-binding transcriptional regulator YiaG